MLGEETLRCGKGVAVNDVAAAVNVDSDEFAAMRRFNLTSDVPLVYLVAEAGSLFGGTAGWDRNLLSTPLPYGNGALRRNRPQIAYQLQLS